MVVSCNGFIKKMLVDWILNRFQEQAAREKKSSWPGYSLQPPEHRMLLTISRLGLQIVQGPSDIHRKVVNLTALKACKPLKTNTETLQGKAFGQVRLKPYIKIS